MSSRVKTELDETELDEAGLVALAQRLAPLLGDGGVIHLHGDLGAGKTTFARALLGALGVGARIKSPTYSLIESYEANSLPIHHLDLYRIAAPDELEFLGLSDLAAGRFLLLAEWPERGGDALPAPDLVAHLAHAGPRRRLRLEPRTARGADWLGILGVRGAA
ncbi:MAG: tRNA (adenosine(37)-N6)-threonylcarbamoyltransferase complex ATPase subunit type 1 TsaE [Proteobacteria bacterium]|uniref:tRNA (adenosine(37)-N6)-threonylcarbamoyltransferase complex ATPase subunit type 1 TsaE n=1 Tax=Rudaea sp. TaxID=2136325 RepID=UPI00321FC8FB|nr:tRNA (adenosine(37)-N6)-threonylcarbamoyltransferase complex ATPase subunit type 1 TsaE [Pseudomonadota bacterium]